jgi:hypothetical protein
VLLIQKLLKTDVNLEQLLRRPTCGSAGSSSSPLVLDGPAELRRVCGPDHTYYIHSSKYRHKKCPGQSHLCQSAHLQTSAAVSCASATRNCHACSCLLPSYRCATFAYASKANAGTGVCSATSLDSKNPSVQAALPAWVKAMLPVVITHCGAVDRRLLQQMTEDLPRGVPAAQVARCLQQLGRQQRCVMQHAYLSAAANQQQPSPPAARHSGTQGQLTQVLPTQPPPAPLPLPAVAPDAYFDSAKWLLSVWLSDVADRLSYEHRCMSAMVGRYWWLDHAFNICKHVRRADGSQPFLAQATVMNERCEVVTTVAVPNTSMAAMAPALQAAAARYPAGEGVRTFL